MTVDLIRTDGEDFTQLLGLAGVSMNRAATAG